MAIEITGQSGDVPVGEKIKLGIKYTVDWGVLKSIQWTVPGKIVKDYQDDISKAVLTDFPPADLTKLTLEFYWVDGGDGRTVEADCVFTSAGKDNNKKITATFNVKAPTLDKMDFKVGTIALQPTAAAPTRVKFSGPGIKWDWKVTVPAVCDGFLKDIQTIQTITKLTLTAGTKQVYAVPGTKVPPADVQLDTANPYTQSDIFPINFPVKVAKGASYSDKDTGDSPATPLSGNKYTFTHDHFKYYILYKPDTSTRPGTPSAIWVPVAVASWFWKEETTLAGGTWTLTKDNSPDGSGAATTEFPIYTSNVKDNAMVNE